MSGASTKFTHPKTCHEEWRVKWARLKQKTYQSESTVPESGGDFTRRFAFELRRDFDFLLRLLTSNKLSGPEDPRPCLLWGAVCIKYLINSRKKGEFSKNDPHKRRHFFRPHFVYNSAISVVHFHWSRLTRDHFRFLHYLPYLHFDDIVSTARTRSRRAVAAKLENAAMDTDSISKSTRGINMTKGGIRLVYVWAHCDGHIFAKYIEINCLDQRNPTSFQHDFAVDPQWLPATIAAVGELTVALLSVQWSKCFCTNKKYAFSEGQQQLKWEMTVVLKWSPKLRKLPNTKETRREILSWIFCVRYSVCTIK